MNIRWSPLLDVVVVSLGSAVTVVVLVTVALVGLSARTVVTVADAGAPRPALSPRAGTVLAVVCLAAVAAIVLFGLWVVVVK